MASLNTDVRATWRDAAHKDPDEIEHDIDDTRAEVQATLEALEHKLSPNRLLDMTLGRVREHGGEFAGNLGHAVKENPLPLLLTSIGIAWMMMSSRHDGNGYALRSGDTGNGHRWRDRLQGAQDRWSDTKHGARDRMSSMKESLSGVKETLHGVQEDARAHLAQSRETLSQAAASVRDTARRAGSATRGQLDRARSGADYLAQEQPLVLGAIGLAAGALIGAALPATAEEDRLMGRARDRALDQAKRAGEQGYRRVRDRAGELATEAKSKLRGDDGGNGGTTSAEHEETDTEWPTDSAAPQSKSTDAFTTPTSKTPPL
jgi:hypothetical protein